MKAVWTGILVGLACGVAAPALASPVTYTIRGTIIAGNDASGQFGGGSLAGAAFTAVETFGPASAQSSWNNANESGANGDLSRTGLHFADVLLSIGASSKRFSDRSSNLSSKAGEKFDSTVQNGFDNLGFYVASDHIKADYTAANTINGLVDRYAGYYAMTDASGAQVVWSNFEVNGLSVVSAVPLPTTAPLFGAGLIALAVIGVRRRRTLVPVSAA